MTTVSLELPLRTIEPAADELSVGMSWRSHRDEDRLLVDPSAGLYGVFDGAGGHGDGAAAASVAARAVGRRVRAGLPGCHDLEAVQQLLDLALTDADAAVGALGTGPAGAPAGVATVTGPSATTATVVVVCRRPADGARLVAVIANLGDSRVQLMHGGRLQTVTLDHSYLSEPDLMQAKARQDRLDSAPHLTTLQDPVDRAAFAHRHLLANAITGGGLQDVRHYLVDLLPGDRLVLDSDGVHDNLTTAELEAALAGSASAPEAAEVAVAQAWRRSEEEPDDLGRAKPDDMTMLVLDVREMDVRQSATGTYHLPPGGAVSLSLSPPTKQYLVSAADLQVLVAQRDGQWWATQPGAAPGEAGSWQLQAGHPVEFGRYEPGGFRTEPSERVSRRHMALQLSEGSELLVVSDLNSTNGTAVLGW